MPSCHNEEQQQQQGLTCVWERFAFDARGMPAKYGAAEGVESDRKWDGVSISSHTSGGNSCISEGSEAGNSLSGRDETIGYGGDIDGDSHGGQSMSRREEWEARRLANCHVVKPRNACGSSNFRQVESKVSLTIFQLNQQ